MSMFFNNFGEMHEPFTAFVTLLEMALYFWLSLNVGRARHRLQVEAPRTDGPPEFMCIFRVQQNTLEQLALHLPLLWLAALAAGDLYAATCGCLWVAGRILYARDYYRDAKKRGKGFLIALLANGLLFVAALCGITGSF